ncbi:SCO family protein [Marinicella rhabdoformis]|uniref:SCO family protein n=1 Tax=Marinicella rhabdoformis TaxID=2580566 RepID=UPI0012AED2F5|nr:SCO family protein [Marinicella rhabdoformis]
MLKNLLILSIAWLLSACQPNDPIEYQNLKLFPQGKAFSGFSLTNQNKEKIDENAFKGKTSVVFFGFTNCPDICPTTLQELKLTDKLLKKADKPSPDFVFISVDPDRDKPENLKSYIEYFNPDFTAATGSDANILSLASQLGVAYHVEDHDEAQVVYDVDHSSALFLINEAGERIGIFPAPHNAATLAADLTLYMEQQS